MKYINKAEAVSLLKNGWVLEFCIGTSLNGWAWVRSRPGAPDSLLVRYDVAQRLAKTLVELKTKNPYDRYYKAPKGWNP